MAKSKISPKFPSGLTIRSNSYWIRFQTDGKRIQRPFARVDEVTEEEAIRQFFEIKNEANTVGADAAAITVKSAKLRNSNWTLEDLFREFMSDAAVHGTDKTSHEGFRPSTIKNHRVSFNQPRLNELKQISIKSLTPSVLRDWYSGQRRANPAQLKALDNLTRNMSSWFGYAVREHMLDNNPLTDSRYWRGKNLFKPRTRRIEVRSSKELKAFLESLITYREVEIKTTSKASRYAIYMYILTGLRQTELLTTRWSDIYWNEGIWFRPASVMKGKRDFKIGFTNTILTLLKQLEKEQQERQVYNPTQYVFLGKDDRNRLKSFRTTLDHITRISGIEKTISVHDLRRTNTDLINEATADGLERKLLRSHSPNTQTEEYTDWELPPDRLQEIYTKIQDNLSKRLTGALKRYDYERRVHIEAHGNQYRLEHLLFRDVWRKDKGWIRNAIHHNDMNEHVSYPSELWNAYFYNWCVSVDKSLEKKEKISIIRDYVDGKDRIEYPTYGIAIDRKRLYQRKAYWEKELGFQLDDFYSLYVDPDGWEFLYGEDPPETNEPPLLGFKNEEGYVINKGESEPKTDQLSLF